MIFTDSLHHRLWGYKGIASTLKKEVLSPWYTICTSWYFFSLLIYVRIKMSQDGHAIGPSTDPLSS